MMSDIQVLIYKCCFIKCCDSSTLFHLLIKWKQNRTPWLISDQYNSCHAFFIFHCKHKCCLHAWLVIDQKSSRGSLVLFPALLLFLCDFGETISFFTTSLAKNLWSMSTQQKENIKTQIIISKRGKFSHTISQLHWSTTSCWISLAGSLGFTAPFDFSWFIANSYLCSSHLAVILGVTGKPHTPFSILQKSALVNTCCLHHLHIKRRWKRKKKICVWCLMISSCYSWPKGSRKVVSLCCKDNPEWL